MSVKDFVAACEKWKRLRFKRDLVWSNWRLDDAVAEWIERGRNGPPPEGTDEWNAAVAADDEAWDRVEELADAAADAVREAGYDPVIVYRLMDCNFEVFRGAWADAKPILRAAEGAGNAKKKQGSKPPTQHERDTYNVFIAVEEYLMREGGVSKVKQDHVHAAAPTVLDSVIGRDSIGVSETYEVQPNLDAFLRAYRRYRDHKPD